jgi:hypothetical protein
MTSKAQAISRIRSSAKSAAHELHKHHMPHTAHAMKVLGGSTAAIGKHVDGWASEASAGMRAAPLSGGHKGRKRSKKGAHKKAGSRRRKLTAKQIAAGFGGKRRKNARRKSKRTGGAKKKSKRRSWFGGPVRKGPKGRFHAGMTAAQARRHADEILRNPPGY